MLSSDNNLTHLGDIALGTATVTCWGWLPILHGLNEFAAYVALYGGAILVVLRIYFMLKDRHAKKLGKTSAIIEE